MDSHKNARLTARSRESLARRVVEEGVTLKLAAASFSVTAKTAAKWVRRFQEYGTDGLGERSSRPHRLRCPTSELQVDAVAGLRRQRWAGCRIARHTGVSRATVSRILRRLKLNRICHLEPLPVYPRYEHEAPGDMLHLDIKKLGRFTSGAFHATGDERDRVRGGGYEYVHVAIDDHSRIAFSSIHPNEQADSAVAALHTTLAWYAQLGIRFKTVLTDNGPCYRSRQFAQACRAAAIKHRRTKPYTPRTNGKAERFIQTALREWAYACSYQNSQQRNYRLPHWLHNYNWHRPHASLNQQPPISRARLDRNNLLRHHTYGMTNKNGNCSGKSGDKGNGEI
jgi:transposase InsO family protein